MDLNFCSIAASKYWPSQNPVVALSNFNDYVWQKDFTQKTKTENKDKRGQETRKKKELIPSLKLT